VPWLLLLFFLLGLLGLLGGSHCGSLLGGIVLLWLLIACILKVEMRILEDAC
jgi:hypothetical protein